MDVGLQHSSLLLSHNAEFTTSFPRVAIFFFYELEQNFTVYQFIRPALRLIEKMYFSAFLHYENYNYWEIKLKEQI